MFKEVIYTSYIFEDLDKIKSFPEPLQVASKELIEKEMGLEWDLLNKKYKLYVTVGLCEEKPEEEDKEDA